MSENPTKCAACDGLGYFRCDCWPGDCICGFGEETCFECCGYGFTDDDDDFFGQCGEDD